MKGHHVLNLIFFLLNLLLGRHIPVKEMYELWEKVVTVRNNWELEWEVCNHFSLHGFRFMMECQKLCDFYFLKEVQVIILITAQPLLYGLPICMPIALLMVDN